MAQRRHLSVHSTHPPPAETHPASSPVISYSTPRHLPFGASLEPALRRACQERLSDITWFRTTWQLGGAATGYATFRDDQNVEQPVVVKLPVPPVELTWLKQLQSGRDVAPSLYASGDRLEAYDLAWVVMERLPHGPLGTAWGGAEFDLTVAAVGRFYAAAAGYPVREPAPDKDWRHILELARKHVVDDHAVQRGQRWNNALKRLAKRLPELLALWNARDQGHWCHGDLHLANAMTRAAPPQGPALLLDYAQVHAGHWVEDAVYFEHLYWARRHRLGGRKLVSQTAAERRTLGLSVDGDWPRLASVKRTLLAMSTPAMLQADGDPHHVAACLEVLETEVGR